MIRCILLAFTDRLVFLHAGCTRCLPGAGERSRADEEVGTDAEGNPWLALPTQVPEDADQLCSAADLHERIPQSAEVQAGEFV